MEEPDPSMRGEQFGVALVGSTQARRERLERTSMTHAIGGMTFRVGFDLLTIGGMRSNRRVQHPASFTGAEGSNHDGERRANHRAPDPIATLRLTAGRANGRRPRLQAVAAPHRPRAEAAGKAVARRACRAQRTARGSRRPDRRDPVELIEEQAASRVPELVPVRYGRMLVSPFTFFRGAAAPMAADLAGAPRTGLDVQLCGDAHLSNFGAFAAPDRRLVFSVNDFDETLPGPFEWDVKRLVASFAVAGRDRGFDAKTRKSISITAARAYREAMREFAGMGNLELWYARIQVDEISRAPRGTASRSRSKRFEHNVAKAQSKDSLKAFAKLTEIVDGEPRIASDPPLIVPVEEVVPPAEHAPARRARSRRHSLLPAHADGRPPPPARALPLRPHGAQGRRRRQRRHARLDHAAARPRRRRSAVPPVQGGGGVRARAVSSARARSPITASGSSRASG